MRGARAKGACARDVLVRGVLVQKCSCKGGARARGALVQEMCLCKGCLCKGPCAGGGLCARARVHTRVCVMSVCVPLINPPLLINGGGRGHPGALWDVGGILCCLL